jgi:hypothetical protein
MQSIEPPYNATTAAAMATLSARLAAETGNDLTLAAPMEDDIPATHEYNRMSTPLSAVFHNVLLVNPSDADRIDYRVITRFDPRLLGLIGARYVLSRTAPTDPLVRVALQQPLVARPEANLYEILGPNNGQYSPTGLRVADDVGEALRVLAGADFDPRHAAVVQSPLPAHPLVPAAEVTIRRKRNGLQVSARSSGWSFIVLPFEFSRCYAVTPRAGTMLPSVVRTDIILTGVFFDHDAEFDLDFVFGIFQNSDCRKRDMDDTRAFGLRPETLPTLRMQFPGRLDFSGLF